MAVIDWITHYPTAQDVPSADQPDLDNAVDDTRVSQIHVVRDKLDSVANEVGSNPGNLPSGCLRERVGALESDFSDRIMAYYDDTEVTESGSVLVVKKAFRFVLDSDRLIEKWRIIIGLWTDGTGETAECQLVVEGSGSEQLAAALTSTATSEEVLVGELVISPSVEVPGTLITLKVELRAVGGISPVAHLKLTKIYGVMHA